MPNYKQSKFSPDSNSVFYLAVGSSDSLRGKNLININQ